MKVVQSGIFSRTVKKLHKQEKGALDRMVRKIINNPEIGDLKVGDLAGVYVHKYKSNNIQYLLAYKIDHDELILTLLALGTHENFYRDLKR